jgi:hypothetical protein
MMTDSSEQSTPLSSRRLELIELLLRKKGISVPRSQTIRRRKETGACPLSFAQERLWFLSRMDAGNPAYNLSAGIRLQGRLDVKALEQTFGELISRHEALRTVFTEIGGRPVQVAHNLAPFSLTPVELRQLPDAARAEQAAALAHEEALRPFDLSSGPLMRVSLWRLADEDYLLLLLMHHIVSDGWSMGVLVREVGALYGAFSTGGASTLRALPIQYGDFACWQREWLQGAVLDRQLSYWRAQLKGAPLLLKLPTDRPRPPVQSSRGARVNFRLPESLSAPLDGLIRQEGATLFILLLAVFKTLLYHYAREEEIIVGSPIANRNRSELEGLIGFFVNSLVLRTRLGGELSFRDVLRRVRETALAAFAHQDLPFEKLVEELGVERDMSYNPLFQVWFVLQNSPMPELELPGLTFSSVEFEKGAVRHDLRLDFSVAPDGLRGSFEYRTDLFDAQTIARMTRHFGLLLREVTKNPDASLNELTGVLDEADMQQTSEQEDEFRRLSREKLKSMRRRAVSGRATGPGGMRDGTSEN